MSKDDLVVTRGTYTIDSQDHCLNGKDSVRIADGIFTLTCDEDGIHAGNDDQQDGYIYIEGGDIDISVGDDAMHAEGLLIITGGDIDISKSYEGIEGYKILVTGGDIDVVANDDGFNAARTDSNGQSDGTQSTEDDQRQTNSFQRRTNDTETNRPELPEKGDRPGDSGTPGGPGMGAGMDADYDAYILITGGTININADGDGIDSNGYLGIAGGSVYVLGPSNNGNGALDYGIYATITGGEMVAVGGSGMEQGFGDESTQCSALVNFDEWIDVGETITLTDSNGNKLLTYKADKRFDSVLISTSDMKQGETYTLTAGDQTSTFAMEDVTYSEGPSSMQGPGGDPDNGGMQRPDSTGNGGMQRPDSTGNGGMQRPDSTGDGSDAGNSQNSDKRQNGGQDNSTQSTETLKNTESISI